MIPLDRWLRDRDVHSGVNVTERPELLTEITADHQDAPIRCGDCEKLSLKVLELERILIEEQARLAEVRTISETREGELRNALCDGLADRLVGAVSTGLTELQRDLEASLVEVLVPFLGRTCARRASDDLLQKVRAAIAGVRDTVIELWAPAELHDLLRSRLGTSSLQFELRDAATIDLILPSGSIHFESLAEMWIETLEREAS